MQLRGEKLEGLCHQPAFKVYLISLFFHLRDFILDARNAVALFLLCFGRFCEGVQGCCGFHEVTTGMLCPLRPWWLLIG